jgi:protoheme IX farnesyltransferase
VKQNSIPQLATILAGMIRLRLSAAVTLSAVTGYFIFNQTLEPSLLLLVPGIFLLAAGASVLNQVTEKKPDALMQRTWNRPLPQKKVSSSGALTLSLTLLSTGIILLFTTGILPGVLGIINIFLYNLVYTRLKRVTLLSILPGAAVGAIPPLIGYTVAGGFFPDPAILLFSGFMFLWQLPHFWLILVRNREDYRKAGFKTFSAQVSEKQIKNLVFLWVLLSTALLIGFTTQGIIFNKLLNAVLIPLNILFIILFHRMLFRQPDPVSGRRAFILVNSFGLLVMLLFVLNALL